MSNDATALLHGTMSFTRALGMIGVENRAERVVIDLPCTDELLTTGEVLHGGALMALADTAGAVAAFLNLPEGAAGTSTIESKTNFLGSVRVGETVRAIASPLHVGGTTIVVETDLAVEDRRVGKVTQTQIVLRPRS